VHLANGLPVPLGIVRDAREPVTDGRISVFGVRHIDIDNTIEEGESFEGIVATGVVDEG
jgi:hypothetical protein